MPLNPCAPQCPLWLKAFELRADSLPTKIRTPHCAIMKTMTRLTVAIPSKPYDVWIENGLLEQAGALVRDVLGERQKLFVVTVASVKRKWGKN